MNFARLNHILIPATRDGRERVRRSWLGRAFAPVGWLFGALSAEGRALTVLLLFVGTAGLSVDTTQIYVLWSALVGLYLAALLARPGFELRGARLHVRGPRRVAVAETVTFELELESERKQPLHDVRISVPFLPWDGSWVATAPPIDVVTAARPGRVEARARFVARGEHQLDAFEAARLVPSGITVGPAIESDAIRFLVVPALANVVRLELPPPRQGSADAGHHAARARDGSELVGVRPYRRGDPVRELHHRTWARRGEPHVREYRPVASSRLALVIDDDGASSEAAFEALLSLAAGVLSRASLLDLDVLGVVAGGAVWPLRSPRGRASLDEALDRLAVLERSKTNDLARFDETAGRWLARATSVVVLTTAAAPRVRELAALVSTRVGSARTVRVRDDVGWLPRAAAIEAPIPGAREISARAVLAGEAIAL